MKRRIHRLRTKIRAFIVEVKGFAKPVQTFLAIEALATIGTLVWAVNWLYATAQGFDPAAASPPWTFLLTCPFVGSAAYIMRHFHLFSAFRRWHGVAMRRLDERWSDT